MIQSYILTGNKERTFENCEKSFGKKQQPKRHCRLAQAQPPGGYETLAFYRNRKKIFGKNDGYNIKPTMQC